MKPSKRINKLNLSDGENPCGRECVPFNETYCFLSNSGFEEIERSKSILKNIPNKKNVTTVAKTMCRLLVNTQNLTFDYTEASDSSKFWKSIAETLTMDQLTGLVTGNGFNAIIDELYKPDMLKHLMDKNYHALIICADINDLKKHNSGPGGHFQGNRAIEAIGRAIKQYSEQGRRSSQMLRNSHDRRNEMRIPRSIAARHHENGDEFVILVLNKGKNINPVETQIHQINEIFSGVEYTYDNRNYKVSATYSFTEVKFPETRDELENTLKKLDKSMMEYKSKIKTEAPNSTLLGNYLNLDA